MLNLNTTLYPPVSYHFMVQILGPSGPADYGFQEVSGFKVSLDTEAISVGGNNQYQFQLPTKRTYSPLVLKRGVVLAGSFLSIWCNAALTLGLDAPIPTFNILVHLLDEKKAPAITWSFINAYPTTYETSDLDAQKGEILFETITMNYEYFLKV